MSRTCVFCGGGPVSQEHVMPRWLAGKFTDEVVDFESTIHLAGDEPQVRPWSGRPFSTTVGGPCQRCNSGWMSRLEQEAKPLVSRLVELEEVSLDPVAQHVLATWAVKTMLMLRLVRQPDDDELADDTYAWLYKQRSPPPAEQVWIGAYDGTGQWPMCFHYYGICLGVPGSDPRTPNAHGAAFAVGHLAFGLAGHAMRERPVASPRVAIGKLRSIWPAVGGDVRFPPSEPLVGDADMRELAAPGDWRER